MDDDIFDFDENNPLQPVPAGSSSGSPPPASQSSNLAPPTSSSDNPATSSSDNPATSSSDNPDSSFTTQETVIDSSQIDGALALAQPTTTIMLV